MTRHDDTIREPVRLGDQEVTRGPGGELHQAAGRRGEVLTTNQGVPVADDQNSLKAG